MVSADGATWTTNAMALNPDWGSVGGAWYNANLGTFAEGTVVRYFVRATDGEETVVSDNGGLSYVPPRGGQVPPDISRWRASISRRSSLRSSAAL